MDKIEKIRQEIERRLKYTHDWLRGDEKRHPKQTFVSKNYYKMKGDERTLDALLSFLDTLSEEPDNSLEEAAERYASIESQAYKGVYCEYYNDKIAFKAGAEWMAKQGVSMEVVRGVPWRAVDAFIHDHDYTEDSIIQIRKK